MIKKNIINNKKLGVYNSWEIISNKIIIKNTDKSVFQSNGSGIPKCTRWFWNIEDIQYNNKVFIEIIYNSQIFKAYIEIDRKNKTRMLWHADLANILKMNFPEYIDYFNKSEKFITSPFIMKFIKSSDFLYNLELINKKLDCISQLLEKNIIITTDEEGQAIINNHTRYERSLKNRLIALKYHGTKCLICGFDFEKAYGTKGKDFIEIHHISPLSKFKKSVTINPKEDLIPLCANCHRIIHSDKKNILSIKEAKNILNKDYVKY